MARVQLVTAAEADAILVPASVYPLWTVTLADADKNWHLMQASDYVSVKWDCGDTVDWTDATTISGDHKEAIARYAYLSLQGKLHPTEDTVGQGGVITKTIKAGSVMKSTMYDYAHPSRREKAFIEPVDQVMLSAGCTMVKGGSVRLTRV